MKTIIIYKSETGFTKQYAMYIQEKLQCQCIDLKDVKKVNLDEYDLIVFGGSIMAGMIKGLKKVKSLIKNQTFSVFSVGLTPQSFKDTIQKIQKDNSLEDVSFCYFEGGVNFDKLGFFSKKMLQMVKNNLKKEAEDEEAIEMIQRLSISKSYVNKESIQPLLREVEKFTHNS